MFATPMALRSSLSSSVVLYNYLLPQDALRQVSTDGCVRHGRHDASYTCRRSLRQRPDGYVRFVRTVIQ